MAWRQWIQEKHAYKLFGHHIEPGSSHYGVLEASHANNDELVDVNRCYKLMYAIVGIMSSGSEVAPRFATKLEELLAEVHTSFALISHSIKPKLHHMRHIIDAMLWLG